MVFSWLPQVLPNRPGANRRCRNRRRRWRPELELLENRLQPAVSPLNQIDHFVIVYQENWSFDALYGNFPGANGIANASATSLSQLDRLTGNPYSTQTGTNNFDLAYNGPQLNTPPQPINNGVIDSRFPTSLNTLDPYNLANFVGPTDTTGDIVHKFYQEQSQINGGAQNQYITWSDNPGLVMSGFDATNLPEGLLAQQYTMDDNFFHAAFGGSFLNHQFLVAAAAPVYLNAAMLNPGALPTLVANGPLAGQLALNPTTGKIVHDGSITPIGSPSFADSGQTFDQNYVVNTTFSVNLSPTFIGNITSHSLLPSQNDSNPSDPNRPYIPTIGDTLDAASVSWKWYSGGWDAALFSSPSNPANNGHNAANPTVDPLFQWHHQPLAYYDNFAPWVNGVRNPVSASHLQDETNFFADLASGNMPAVSFIKPLGPDNEHPGYTSLLRGQQHVADIVHAVQNSPDWAHTAIIVTYDENGGRWDHVSAPDANGIWGDGTRVPTIVISPYSKQGTVDHTEHDTLSILKTIEQRFNLPALNQFDASASSLADNFQSTAHVSLGAAYVQPSADTPGTYTLIVQGTEGQDNIHVSLDNGQLRVQIQGTNVQFDQDFAQAISRIEVYGQGGDDQIQVDSAVTTPAFIFSGGGNDRIQAGGGNSVVVGGAGSEQLAGGPAASILIGGAGADSLQGNSENDLLIPGTTFFDANLAALKALLAEWTSGDFYSRKVARLTGTDTGGLNGSYFLNIGTVFDDNAPDLLSGASGGLNFHFARLTGPNKDKIKNLQPGETVIDI